MDKSIYISLRKSNNFSEIIYQFYLEINSNPVDSFAFETLLTQFLVSAAQLKMSNYNIERDILLEKIISHYNIKFEITHIMKIDPQGNQIIIDIY